MLLSVAFLAASLFLQVNAHYVFPFLVVNGVKTGEWVTDVTSADFRCYTSETQATASTIKIAAGSSLGFMTDGTISHPGVLNVYMAKATGDAASFKGDGAVWFKVYEETATTDGGTSITWPPSYNAVGVTFTIPKNLPNGQYLVRIEHIALHGAQTFGGAQFYIACGQIEVTGGGSGTPSPLVAIPGVYTGNEPGILINIYWPIPTNYTQPGPRPWKG